MSTTQPVMRRLIPLLLLVLAAPALAADGQITKHFRILDGDTFDVRVRISNIDTPELRGECWEEKALAQAAKARAIELLESGRFVLRAEGFDRSGRILATVELEDGSDFGGRLVGEELAIVWVGSQGEWCR